MRNKQSLFNRACEFVNTVPVGSAFTSKEYIGAIGNYENSTPWKRGNGNRHYNCHQYKGYLKKAGFISKIEHGVWGVDRHIPNWFDFGHLSVLLGYGPPVYKGMNYTDIIAQLDHDAHHPNGVKPRKKLAKLYSTNRETYEFFIRRVKDMEINLFKTKNELAAFIEEIKWPGIASDGSKPTYAVKGNYQPIIDHLLADGWITQFFDGYRYSYTVNYDKPYSAMVNKSSESKPAGRKQVRAAVVSAIRTVPPNKTNSIDTSKMLNRLEAMERVAIAMAEQLGELIQIVKTQS
jgi:hypothetical protein